MNEVQDFLKIRVMSNETQSSRINSIYVVHPSRFEIAIRFKKHHTYFPKVMLQKTIISYFRRDGCCWVTSYIFYIQW